MPSIAIIFLQIVALVAFTGFSPRPPFSCASPLSKSVSSIPDYSAASHARTPRTNQRNDTALAHAALMSRAVLPVRTRGLETRDDVDQFHMYASKATASAQKYSKLPHSHSSCPRRWQFNRKSRCTISVWSYRSVNLPAWRRLWIDRIPIQLPYFLQLLLQNHGPRSQQLRQIKLPGNRSKKSHQRNQRCSLRHCRYRESDTNCWPIFGTKWALFSPLVVPLILTWPLPSCLRYQVHHWQLPWSHRKSNRWCPQYVPRAEAELERDSRYYHRLVQVGFSRYLFGSAVHFMNTFTLPCTCRPCTTSPHLY